MIVIDAALGGMPARRAAAQFEIGIVMAIVLVRGREGGAGPGAQLDPQRDFLLGLVEQTLDLTIEINSGLPRCAASRRANQQECANYFATAGTGL